MLIVFTTAPNVSEAEALAQKIVEAKLGACVQVLPRMRSFYRWNGKVQSDPEHLLLIKTLPERFADLEAFIRSNHSYEVPEIIAVRSESVSEGYLNWVTDSLR